MGTSKRYAHVVAQQINDRLVDVVARGAKLESLTDLELELDRLPITIDPLPKPVSAWVRFDRIPVRVDAEACRWTSTAVGIRFRVGETTHRCWVWRGAVEDR
ncbi:hypothetical protein [Microbacterium hominis]|uniref:Uncharacterized protein n=1 Tax=Microbacterium hominis TaxID=162426 RepID=A0A2K9D9L4_9MICO|nr:hypothetical protein [Microbacterium hominis]AUG29572.1 hypothetical protein CXR34_08995 [Microbacterium hominis]EPD84280.1 hypothetical protein HMPREF1529_02345 [Microbacterium sp. oral taxon 186 str. F0373]